MHRENIHFVFVSFLLPFLVLLCTAAFVCHERERLLFNSLENASLASRHTVAAVGREGDMVGLTGQCKQVRGGNRAEGYVHQGGLGKKATGSTKWDRRELGK